MAISIAFRKNPGGDAVGIIPDKDLRGGCRQQRIDGRIQISIGPVFETHRHGKSAGPLPVVLRFGGPGADASPGDQTGQAFGSRLA